MNRLYDNRIGIELFKGREYGEGLTSTEDQHYFYEGGGGAG